MRSRPRLAAPLPQPPDLEREHADAVNAERRKVAEEQHDDAGGRQDHADRPGALAHGDPAGQRPQRDADAENVVHQADEEDVIIEQRDGEQRHRRPAADQRAVERERAGDNEREHRDHEDLAGEIDLHHLRQQRHDQVHGQIGNDLPLDFIEVGELRVLRQRRHRLHAGEMIDVIRQRRQRMRPDRDRDQEGEGRGHDRDVRAGEAAGAEARDRVAGAMMGLLGDSMCLISILKYASSIAPEQAMNMRLFRVPSMRQQAWRRARAKLGALP